MPFALADFIRLRPTCVHRTHVDNVVKIERTRALWPAAHLYESARINAPAQRRTSQQDLVVQTEFGRVRLNDQDPFIEKFGQFTEGWTADQFRDELNRRVFFWPMRKSINELDSDDRGGGSELAEAFLRKYAESSMLVVVPTKDLFEINEIYPEFSCCNSGTLSARTLRYNVRGPRTFLSSENFAGTSSKVRELAFRGRMRLPRSMRIIKAGANA